MKSIFAGVSLLMLGAALSVGCGGSQDAQEAQPQAPAQTPAPTDSSTASETPPPWTQGQAGTEKKVGELRACCYIKCSKWHGPFPDVDWGSCGAYGPYYCGQQGGGAFSEVKWDNC